MSKTSHWLSHWLSQNFKYIKKDYSVFNAKRDQLITARLPKNK